MTPNYRPETPEATASQRLSYESSQPPLPPSVFPTCVDAPPPATDGRGLAQAFSLHPFPAVFAITADAMVSAIDVATLGITAPFLWFIASIATFAVVFMAQKKWGGDTDSEAALKAVATSVLVALPTPFPAFLTVPSGVLGLVHMLRRRP